jgi:hypothetical protein
MLRSFVILAMLLSVVVLAPTAVAQDATPTAATCDAPELPPGTPTPMEDVPPAQEAPPPAEPEASPADGEEPPAAEEMPADDAPPTGNPASEEEAAAAEAAVLNLFGCLNSSDFLGLAALFTDNFLQNFIGVPTPYDVEASMEGVQPVELVAAENAMVYADGSISVDIVFTGLFNGPGAIGSERWFLVEEDGYWKLDNITPIPLPEGALEGAVVIDVQMVDYAFALSEYTVPANTPVVFRTTNHSHSGAGHVNVLVTFPEGTTSEQLIQGEVDIDSGTGFFGALFLEPGQSGDLAFTGLEAGTYFLVCDVTTEDGTPHFEIGMVTMITVE